MTQTDRDDSFYFAMFIFQVRSFLGLFTVLILMIASLVGGGETIQGAAEAI